MGEVAASSDMVGSHHVVCGILVFTEHFKGIHDAVIIHQHLEMYTAFLNAFTKFVSGDARITFQRPVITYFS